MTGDQSWTTNAIVRMKDGTAANPQTDSPLFRLLPRELCDGIYTHLFSLELPLTDCLREHL